MEWTNQRAFVTGAAGFIGSHLVERLLLDGAQVRALVHYNSRSSTGWLREIPSEFLSHLEIVYGDVTDPQRMNEVVKDCTIVFHLGALISVPYSYVAPDSFVRTNVVGTQNILDAACRNGGTRVIQTSTSEVYGTPEAVPITESHPLRAQSPYSASKIAADKLGESYFCSFGLPVTILRPFNTYGPRQSARAVLPAILTQLLSGARELHLGSLSPRRDLTYVTDTVDGFIKAADSPATIGRVVQLGTGQDFSIGELVELAMEITGRKAEVRSDEQRIRPNKSEVQRLLSKPALAAELMNWRPAVSIKEGIERTADWLRANLALYTPDRYLV